MMDPGRIASLPARPGAIPEWEDLLVRFEIMPRALRVAMEELNGSQTDAAPILGRLLDAEILFAGWLGRAAYGEEPAGRVSASAGGDPAALADRFSAARARSFAMLQRRGVEVWEWTAPIEAAGPVTAYQMVSALVRADAEALADLRAIRHPGAATC